MGLFTMFDFRSEEAGAAPIISTMALELATILLGLGVAAIAVLYAAPRGYMGHKRIRTGSVSASTPTVAYEAPPAPAPAVEAPPPANTQVEEPAPSPAPAPAPAIYEMVQPAPAPVTYAAPSTTSFGSPSITRKPTRTYRRRTAPVRSASAAKASKTKPKKR